MDHSSLKLALGRAEELCSQVNEGVREKEHADRLEWLQTHVQCEGLAEVRPVGSRAAGQALGGTGASLPQCGPPAPQLSAGARRAHLSGPPSPFLDRGIWRLCLEVFEFSC